VDALIAVSKTLFSRLSRFGGVGFQALDDLDGTAAVTFLRGIAWLAGQGRPRGK
jgi:hypothetical protein